MNGNLYDILSARFPADRERPAIELPDGRTHSYGDLEAASARLAHGLEAAGARPGDRVMVQVEKTPEAVFLYLACLRAGLVYLPLNSGYRQSEVEYFLADAEPRVVVSDSASPLADLPALAKGGARWFSLDQHGDGRKHPPPAAYGERGTRRAPAAAVSRARCRVACRHGPRVRGAERFSTRDGRREGRRVPRGRDERGA